MLNYARYVRMLSHLYDHILTFEFCFISDFESNDIFSCLFCASLKLSTFFCNRFRSYSRFDAISLHCIFGDFECFWAINFYDFLQQLFQFMLTPLLFTDDSKFCVYTTEIYSYSEYFELYSKRRFTMCNANFIEFLFFSTKLLFVSEAILWIQFMEFRSARKVHFEFWIRLNDICTEQNTYICVYCAYCFLVGYCDRIALW